MSIQIYDPTYEADTVQVSLSPRPATLKGLRIGLVDNTKFNSDHLLLRIAQVLERDHGARSHVIRRKKNAATPVDAAMVALYKAECDVVVAGIGD